MGRVTLCWGDDPSCLEARRTLCAIAMRGHVGHTRTMAPLRTWYGDHALKQAVLEHLDADCEAASLRPLRIADRAPLRYWDLEPADLDVMRAAFGIPRSVLAFGLDHGGIIENERTTRWAIDAVRTFLRAVPIGAHVDSVPAELAAWRLDDPHHGVITLVEGDVRIEGLLKRIAEALRHSLVDGELREALTPLAEEWGEEIPRQWQATKKVDPRVYAHCRALETARHALDVPTDDFALHRVVDTSLYGVSIPWSAGTRDLVDEHFQRLLREAGGWG